MDTTPCEGRIDAQMENRTTNIAEMLAVHTGEQEPTEDTTEDTIYEFGLEIQKKVTLKYLMSWGGPSDWLEIVCSGDGIVVENVTYHFADWGDHAARDVPESSPLWRFAEWVADTAGQ